MPMTPLKWLGLAAVAALLGAALFMINLIWFRPFSLDLFHEKVFVQLALAHPELLTRLGVAEQYGYRRHNAHLNDLSPAKSERDLQFWRQVLADLDGYDLDRQSPAQQLSSRALRWYAASHVDGARFRFHDYPVNPHNGVQIATPEFLITGHVIEDERGARDFLARLDEIGRQFDQLLEGLQERERRGIVPPRFIIEAVLTQMRGFESKYARDNPLYVHFSERVHSLGDVQSTQVLVMQARCAELVEIVVRPAYRKLIAFLEGQLQRATQDGDGVWKLPDGDAYYAYQLHVATTSHMSPQAAHDLGLAEVARLEAQLRASLEARRELRAGESPAQALLRLGRGFLYPDADSGRVAMLADYGRMLATLQQRARQVIGLLPRARLEVARLPQFKEARAPAAQYTGPSLDGTRPAVLWINLRDMRDTGRLGMWTLALHAGVPGHHLQHALAAERQSGPGFRRLALFPAFSEGWAVYAESLGTELGDDADDPWNEIARLQASLIRAARLVVDTGVHYKRWPRAQAVAWMAGKTGLSDAAVATEVERCIVMPAQVCVYHLGALRFQAARRRAEAALGPAWDATAEKAFHDMVLGGGALPLDLLDEQVDGWIRGATPR